MNYFALYNLPESFRPDEAALRNAYYRLSREFHPDFHANRPAAEQQHALEMATLNTDAYRTLSDFDRRTEYILRQHELLRDGVTPELPAAFLAEMMDLNEQLMELEFDPDSGYDEVAAAADALENNLNASIEPTLVSYATLPTAEQAAARQQVLDYYLKRRYLLRIRQQLAKFAGRS